MDQNESLYRLIDESFPHVPIPESKTENGLTSLRFLNFEIEHASSTAAFGFAAGVLEQASHELRRMTKEKEEKKNQDLIREEQAKETHKSNKQISKSQEPPDPSYDKIFDELNKHNKLKSENKIVIADENTNCNINDDFDFLIGIDYKSLIEEPEMQSESWIAENDIPCESITKHISKYINMDTKNTKDIKDIKDIKDANAHTNCVNPGCTTPSYIDEDLQADEINHNIPEMAYFNETLRDADRIGYVEVIRKVCKYYQVDYPEYEFIKENGVYICTAVFCGISFCSSYILEKEISKENAAQRVCEYMQNYWSVIFKNIN